MNNVHVAFIQAHYPALKSKTPFTLALLPAVALLGLYVVTAILPERVVFEAPRLGSIVDALTAYTSLNLGVLLILARDFRERGVYARYTCAATGLLFVGVLRGFASGTENVTFTLWLHGLGRIFGGLFFFVAWFPSRRKIGPFLRYFPTAGFVFSISLSLWLLVRHPSFPRPLEDIAFSPSFQIANGLGGTLYLLAAYFGLARLDLRSSQLDYDTMLLPIAIFSGLAGVSFWFIHPWGPRWWGAEVLDVFPLLLALVYTFGAYRQLQRKLLVTTRALERSNANLEHFAYMASHDLQEPLRTVSSFLMLLKSRYAGRLSTEADEYIGFAVDGAKRMSCFIKDLLEYSRLESRAQPARYVRGEKVIEAVRAGLHTAIAESCAYIDTGALPELFAPMNHLLLLFQNLVSNAVKYRGAAPPQITIRAEKQGAEWLFTVRDNGIGFDMKDAERIFGMFERAHGKHEYAGTGIGLAMCKKIVESWGGRIWADSEVGRGSVFSFTVPETIVKLVPSELDRTAS